MKKHIGFIGLGKMGAGMAANLLAGGFELSVYNRSADKAVSLLEQGAEWSASPAQAVKPDGIAVTMLANDQAVDEVVCGEKGLLKALGNGGIHLSMSTLSPETSRRLAALHRAHGAEYLAAPVFGRPDAAAARKLWICLSGEAGARTRVKPLLEMMGQGIFEFGDDPGAANVVKLAGNFMIAAAIESMSEAAVLAEKSGIAPEALFGMLGQTIFACPIYQNYGRLIGSGNYQAGFKLALGYKDMQLTRNEAGRVQVPLPLLDLLHRRLLSGMAKGRGEMDWGALALGAREDAGL